MESSIKASSYCTSSVFGCEILSYLLLKWLLKALKQSPTYMIGPYRHIFAFILVLRSVNIKWPPPLPPQTVLYLCPYSPMQRSFESHLDWHSVLWNATYLWWPPLPPWKSCSPIHTPLPPTTWPPKSRLHCGAVFKARAGRGGRDSCFEPQCARPEIPL